MPEIVLKIDVSRESFSKRKFRVELIANENKSLDSLLRSVDKLWVSPKFPFGSQGGCVIVLPLVGWNCLPGKH